MTINKGKILFMRICIILISSLFLTITVKAQVTIDPYFPGIDDQITVYFDATKGNGALANCNCTVYAHAGLITSKSSSGTDWKYVQGNWGKDDAHVKMQKVSDNLYSLTYNIRDFYGIPDGEKIIALAFVFRNVSGSVVGRAADGSDIYYPFPDPLAGLQYIVLSPGLESRIVSPGQTIDFHAVTNKNADIQLKVNDEILAQVNGAKSLIYLDTLSQPGDYRFKLTIQSDTISLDTSWSWTIPSKSIIHNMDPGWKIGPNFSLDGSITFVLEAPGKEYAYWVSDLYQWGNLGSLQMFLSPDSQFFFITVDTFGSGGEIKYQYWLDNGLKVPDPISYAVLDPANDKYISSATYANLPKYPQETTGLVSFLDLTQPYQWQAGAFAPPESKDLVVYELLVRDFIESHDFKTLSDTISYLKRLGVNAVEVMPPNEFEGNISWGYNPSLHSAIDKYYGPINGWKYFIDLCHKNGIAVIADVVFNHAFSQNPMVQMYWDTQNNRPAANSPWFNPVAKHPYNVGYDFNHDSPSTKRYVDRILNLWLTEYKLDGFRFDLSKGFTQRNTPNDVTAWGLYDPDRIAILNHYRQTIQAINPDAYIILEHFAENKEEEELSEDGFLLWGNLAHDYAEAAMGYSANLAYGYYQNRGWSSPGLITYMESHDEERILYKIKNFGKSISGYDTKSLANRYKRAALASTFFYTIPGPKMLWEFGELGYDYSINTCPDGTISNNCRTDPKPIRWDFLDQQDRLTLWGITAALIHLRTILPGFNSQHINYDLDDYYKTISMDAEEYKMMVLGNFDVQTLTKEVTFPSHEWYYNYLGTDSINASGVAQNVPLTAGEYKLYLNKKLANLYLTLATKDTPIQSGSFISPNPIKKGDIFEISMSNPNQHLLKAQILNISGEVIKSVIFDSPNRQMSLSTSGITSGLYLVKLFTNKGIRIDKLLII